MLTFTQYLDKIELLKKSKKNDEAWKVANEGIVNLLKQKEEMWFMMYYQMADILAREKKWEHALFQMGLVIHYLRRLGGIIHTKFVKKLLSKFNKSDQLDKYVEICLQENDPEKLELKLRELTKS